MASLFLFDEHVAWQKRVQKEIMMASKFNEDFKEPEPKLFLRAKFSRKPSPFIETRACLPQVRQRIFAEVRGKYARPDRTMNPYCLPELKERTWTVASSRRTASSVPRSEQGLMFEEEENDDEVMKAKKELRQERLRRLIAEREIKRRERQLMNEDEQV